LAFAAIAAVDPVREPYEIKSEVILVRLQLLYARKLLFPLSRAVCRLGVNLDAKGKSILTE
jgi:hypothetical protein